MPNKKPRKTSRNNVTRSCVRCKFKKVKCSGHLGPKPCDSCKVRNISADDCIFQPPTRRGPKKVVKNEVIKVGKNDSDDPPESFTDNNEFDAFLQFELFITRNRNHGTIVDGSNPRLHVPNPRQQHEPNPRQQHTPYPRQQHAPNPRQPNPRQHKYTSLNIDDNELGSEGRKALADALTSWNFHYYELGSERGKAFADDLDLYNNNPFFGSGAPSTCDFLGSSHTQVPPVQEALEVTTSVTSANELFSWPHLYEIIVLPHILLLPTSTKQTRSTRPTKQMRSTQPTKQTRSTQPTKQTRSTQPTKQT
ncbi:hypothetical protein C2G38_2241011 [Gigaspora rosea]|uniref:Zn(2)-C6 fungal-type domain-containing protein n=1 Tax=Gigaspora rosea TaxID=44941 RepID=A0A397VTX1_9GLOM|nr:hypothetical protein C2G38_2241011 [Gigaspora rosea]